jgi:hypothetical protein
VTQPAESCLDLVQYQQGIVAPAAGGHLAQVPGGRHDHAGLALHRLDDHAGRPGMKRQLPVECRRVAERHLRHLG